MLCLFLLVLAYEVAGDDESFERFIFAPDIPPYQFSELKGNNATGRPPTRRKDFGVAYYNSSVYIFGGVDVEDDKTYTPEVWAFNTDNYTWHLTKFQFRRRAHCVTQIGNIVYLIGGVGEEISNFVSLDLDTGAWTFTLEPLKKELLYPACAVVDGIIGVWGGCDATGECYNKIYSYNNFTWDASPINNSTPSSREGSTMTYYVDYANNFNYFVILGGKAWNDTQRDPHASMYLYRMADPVEWLTPVDIPDLPQLAFHTAVLTTKGALIIFGGLVLQNNTFNQDTFILDFNTTHVNVTVLSRSNFVPHRGHHPPPLLDAVSSYPAPRYGHAAYYSNNRMLLYGGKTEKVTENTADVWQFIVQKECLQWHTCGECLLANCYLCNPPNTSYPAPLYCIAGDLKPYIHDTCPGIGWNINQILSCRRDHKVSGVIISVTVFILVLIFILVVATYFVDWKKGKASSNSSYERIE